MAEELDRTQDTPNTSIDDMEATVSLTPKAVEVVKRMRERDRLAPEQALRVGVVGGGCSGFQYALSFDSRKDDDTVLEVDGVQVLVDRNSLIYIAGTTLDYVEGLHGAGFRFSNPRASRTCGCGSSFSV